MITEQAYWICVAIYCLPALLTGLYLWWFRGWTGDESIQTGLFLMPFWPLALIGFLVWKGYTFFGFDLIFSAIERKRQSRFVEPPEPEREFTDREWADAMADVNRDLRNNF